MKNDEVQYREGMRRGVGKMRDGREAEKGFTRGVKSEE